MSEETAAPVPPVPNLVLTYQKEPRNFKYCCGIAEMGNFMLQDPELAKQRTVGEHKAALARMMRMNSVSSLVASTIHIENNIYWTEINRQLKEIGFKKVSDFHNGNSGNTVILWHYS
jgi:hypothetical protein